MANVTRSVHVVGGSEWDESRNTSARRMPEKGKHKELLEHLARWKRNPKADPTYDECLTFARAFNRRRLRFRPEPKPVPYGEFPEGF